MPEIDAPPFNEIQCLRLAAAGDHSAFACLHDRYSQKSYAYALMMTRSEYLAEEIMQEVFMKIWLHKDRLAGIENFSNWLYIITRNHTVSCLKRQTKEQIDKQEFGRQFPINPFIREHALLYKEYLGILHKGVALLPPRQKEVYQLSREQGWRQDAIATRLKLSPRTVKVHMVQALHFVRDYVSASLEK